MSIFGDFCLSFGSVSILVRALNIHDQKDTIFIEKCHLLFHLERKRCSLSQVQVQFSSYTRDYFAQLFIESSAGFLGAKFSAECESVEMGTAHRGFVTTKLLFWRYLVFRFRPKGFAFI